MTSDPSVPTARTARPGEPVWTLPRLGGALVVGLLVQVVIGVADSLWGTLPSTAWHMPSSAWLLNAHMLIAVVLELIAVWALVQAVRQGERLWTAAGVVGVVGITLGLVTGVFFLGADGSNAVTFLMAVGGVAALGAYVLALTRGSSAA